MTPDEIKSVVEEAVRDGLHFDWWAYVLFFAITFSSAYIGGYVRKRSENKALKHDFDSILEQVRRTTIETEAIKSEMSKGSWLHQQSWSLKVRYYTGIVEALYKYRLSVLRLLDYYVEPGSEHNDQEIQNSKYYDKIATKKGEALTNLDELQGSAEIVLSRVAIDALSNFQAGIWEAAETAICNKDYLSKAYDISDKAYLIILAEAKNELV